MSRAFESACPVRSRTRGGRCLLLLLQWHELRSNRHRGRIDAVLLVQVREEPARFEELLWDVHLEGALALTWGEAEQLRVFSGLLGVLGRRDDAAAAPAGGFDSPVALVEHVLELAAGSSDLIAFATAAEPYFAATSDGRRSAAQLGSMRQLSADVTPRWTVSAARAGGVRAELIEGGQMVRMMMPVLIFETVNEGGLLIASVAVER